MDEERRQSLLWPPRGVGVQACSHTVISALTRSGLNGQRLKFLIAKSFEFVVEVIVDDLKLIRISNLQNGFIWQVLAFFQVGHFPKSRLARN